jgi:hypothetical protein
MNKNNLWQHLKEALLGGQAAPTDAVNIQGVDTTSPEYKENMAGAAADITVSQNPRVGGLIPDIRAGYRENAYNPLKVENLGQDFSADGRKKGAGYRFGEFAGTAARLLDNPLVRGGIAYGLSKSMGDRRPLVEGLTAAVGTQQNRMKDQMYRQALAERDIDTSGIRGWLGDDTFKYLLEDQQVKDNAEYRNTYLETQRQNQALSNWVAQQKLEYDKISDAADRALKKEQIDVQRQRYANNLNKLSSKDLTAYRDNLATIKDVEAGLNLIEQNPNAYSLVKGALPAWATNRIDPKGIQTRTQIDNITAVYRKWLTGAQMSDAERKAYERFLPAPTDNYETIKAKLQGMRDSIERKNSILMQGANEYQNMIDTEDNDPLGVR